MLYDADCGFCTRAISLAPRLHLTAAISTIQAEDLPSFGIDPQRAGAEMPAVRPDGSVVYGHAAIAAGLLTGPRPVRMLGHLIARLPWLPARVYRWVADHRHQLPGGTGACELTPP